MLRLRSTIGQVISSTSHGIDSWEQAPDTWPRDRSPAFIPHRTGGRAIRNSYGPKIYPQNGRLARVDRFVHYSFYYSIRRPRRNRLNSRTSLVVVTSQWGTRNQPSSKSIRAAAVSTMPLCLSALRLCVLSPGRERRRGHRQLQGDRPRRISRHRVNRV